LCYFICEQPLRWAGKRVKETTPLSSHVAGAAPTLQVYRLKEALGVSHTQLGVLWMLESKPGVMLKDVSDQMGINASAITALIGRMEDAGLVRRELSDEDGRVAHIFATKEGLAKAVAARPILSQLNSRLLADFSDREIAAVARFLNTILERF
jgi:DNA-binding MarR family transcriptional regulator